MPTLRTPAAELEYLDEGPADGPVVLLLHGFPDVPATWDAVVDALPEGVRVIRPFLRGVGGSRVVDPAAASGQVAALATDVLDLVSALGLGSAVLVGHDWGARAAHAAAVLSPSSFTGLVTLSTAYGPSSGFSGTELLDDAAAAWYRYWLCTAAGAAAYRSAPSDLTRWAWRHWSPGLALSEAEMSEILAATDTEDFAETVVHYYRHGAGEAEGAAMYEPTQSRLDAWPAIEVPATFLIGDADGCETLTLARTNGPLFAAGRELLELDGVGHFIPRERPDVVAQAIRRHLEAGRR